MAYLRGKEKSENITLPFTEFQILSEKEGKMLPLYAALRKETLNNF